MNKEDTEAFELVKDFLKQNGLRSTLECLEKEENYKNITSEKKKVFSFLIIIRTK
jgi:hypothetical protein